MKSGKMSCERKVPPLEASSSCEPIAEEQTEIQAVDLDCNTKKEEEEEQVVAESVAVSTPAFAAFTQTTTTAAVSLAGTSAAEETSKKAETETSTTVSEATAGDQSLEGVLQQSSASTTSESLGTSLTLAQPSAAKRNEESVSRSETRTQSPSRSRSPPRRGRRHDEVRDPRKLFIGGLPKVMETPEMRSFFEQFGAVEDCVVIKESETGRGRGFGFVTYRDLASADRVLRSVDSLLLAGRRLDIKKAVPKSDTMAVSTRRASVRHTHAPRSDTGIFSRVNTRRRDKMFVGGLPEPVTDSELTSYFRRFGHVADAVVMFDAAGRSRRFGFISFSESRAVDQVLRSAPHYLRGTKLTLERAVPKNEMDSRPPTARRSGGSPMRGAARRYPSASPSISSVRYAPYMPPPSSPSRHRGAGYYPPAPSGYAQPYAAAPYYGASGGGEAYVRTTASGGYYDAYGGRYAPPPPPAADYRSAPRTVSYGAPRSGPPVASAYDYPPRVSAATATYRRSVSPRYEAVATRAPPAYAYVSRAPPPVSTGPPTRHPRPKPAAYHGVRGQPEYGRMHHYHPY